MEVKTYTIDEIKNIVTPIAEKYQIAQVYPVSYTHLTLPTKA